MAVEYNQSWIIAALRFYRLYMVQSKGLSAKPDVLHRALHAAAIRLRTRLRRDKGVRGISSPKVALVEQISSLLSPEKAAEGETLRHMSRTTTHAYHLPVQNPAFAGARGAGGGVSTPAKKKTSFALSPFFQLERVKIHHCICRGQAKPCLPV